MCVCVYLRAPVAVLRGEDEARQVAGQVQPSEVPHQVPVDDGMEVHHVGCRDDGVALVLQKTLQLLPQHQGAQVGHRHGLRVVKTPLHAQRVLGEGGGDREDSEGKRTWLDLRIYCF